MKRLLLIVVCSLMLFSCQPESQPPAFLDGRILFLGDSITQDGRYVSMIEYELFKRYPSAKVDLISIGLSSETVSGLTEPNHAYPRPNVHDRLDRALEAVQPQTVFACYGMNDGIYHPQSEERFTAYQEGINRLINKVQSAGAQLILLTPPMFDATVISEKVVDAEAPRFGYATPYIGYNDVLADYAEWLLSLEQSEIRVCDLNGPMLEYTRKARQEHPGFSFSDDGVHPQWAGHALMALQTLQCIGVPVEDVNPETYAEQVQTHELFQLVHERRRMRSMAWLVDIGFQKPGDYEALPVETAEVKADSLKNEILSKVQPK